MSDYILSCINFCYSIKNLTIYKKEKDSESEYNATLIVNPRSGVMTGGSAPKENVFQLWTHLGQLVL